MPGVRSKPTRPSGSDSESPGITKKGSRMSRHETVNAYLSGRIDRREFVRRLTIAGVSTAAAVAYASSLSSDAAAAPASRDAHGLTRFQAVTPAPTAYTNTEDADDDGLTDDEEGDLGTDPNNPDTDGDGVKDGDEVKCGSDPLDKNSKCGSGNGTAALPNTGSGSANGDGTKWLAPLAVAGAGAAYLMRGARKISGKQS